MMTTIERLARLSAIAHRFFYSDEYTAPLWKKWSTYSSIYRPVPKEIETYRKFIGTAVSSETNLLILGASPELRDIAAELGLRPFLIDISLEMLIEMLRYTKHANKQNEIWIRGCWLTTPLPENTFDIIVSDLFLHNINPGHKQKKLLSKISKIATPHTKIITRIHTINPKNYYSTYEKILDETRRLLYEIEKYDVMNVLLSRLIDKSAKNQKMDSRSITGNVEHYLSSGNVSFSYQLFLYEFLAKRIYPLSRDPLASQTKEEVESLLSQNFSIIDVWNNGEYPESEFYPIYVLAIK